MKTLLLTAALLISATASALVPTSGMKQFTIVDAQFSTNHVRNPENGTLTLDLNESKVTLTVLQHNNCPINAMCILSMPMPLIVELPIVKIEQDSCGTQIITALHDSRPVDGALEIITVTDYSSTFCEMFLPYIAKATYKTKYFNRINGKQITNLSTMGLLNFN